MVYGYPNPVDMVAAEQGLLVLGGCVIYGDDPNWYCKFDQTAWVGPDPTRAIGEALFKVELSPAQSTSTGTHPFRSNPG